MIIDYILHIDQYLLALTQNYGLWIYGIIFAILFIETGLVIMPFLPGDSLLFAAGALASLGNINLALLIFLCAFAAILGDTINYHIGKYLGSKVFKYENSIFFKKEYLLKTQKFYDKHGKKTIFLARFIPIIRTFAPFVAGVGNMKYTEFLKYNIVGGIIWTSLFLVSGYLFGNITIVQENFSLVLVGIIIISFLPIVYELFISKQH